MNSELRTYTAGELAKMALPGFPTSDVGMRKHAIRKGWPYVKAPGRGPDGTEMRFTPPPEVMELISLRLRGELPPEKPMRKAETGNLEARMEQGRYLVIRDESGHEIDELVRVPRHDVKVSGGAGAVVSSEQIVDWLVFKATWIREIGLQPDRLVLVEAVGDSMLPTVQRGDLLLVDLRVNSASQEAVFVIRRDNTLQVKRLQQMFTGEIYIKSDNPSYTTEIVPNERVADLQILGRVVWSGRKM